MHVLPPCNKLVSQPNDVLLIETLGLGQSKQFNAVDEVGVAFQLAVCRLPAHMVVHNLAKKSHTIAHYKTS